MKKYGEIRKYLTHDLKKMKKDFGVNERSTVRWSKN